MNGKNSSNGEILITGLKLLFICAVAGLVLSLVNSLTEPVIKERMKADELAALQELFPGGEFGDKQEIADENFSPVAAVYPVRSAGEEAGWILELAGQGYGGYMKIMASYSLAGRILNVKLMENEETPGLGKQAENSAYMSKFIGKGGDGEYPVPVTKEMLASQQTAGTAGDGPLRKSLPQRIWEAVMGASTAADTDSVSGATITFSGIAQTLTAGSNYILSLKKGDSQ